MSEDRFIGGLEVHPLHGLSNRLLAVLSVILIGIELDRPVVIDWRLDDSKFMNAPMAALLDLSMLPSHVRMKGRGHGVCDAYFKQMHGGWHLRTEKGFSASGGGFVGQSPGLQLDEFVQGLPPCNETKDCSAYFRAFETVDPCQNNKGWLGLSLWSPIRPLNGTCAFAVLPPSPRALELMRWVPPRTLGVHVRRGDLDSHWPRASTDEWFAEVDRAMKERNLKFIFLASDDATMHASFSERYGDVVLPRILNATFLPPPTKRRGRLRLWSKDGNVQSLAEQLTLGTSDYVLGSWGSTYSTMAAAWFDRPVSYLPRRASDHCINSTIDHRPCSWRGHTSSLSGSKCGKLIDVVDAIRSAQNLTNFFFEAEDGSKTFRRAILDARRRCGLPQQKTPFSNVRRPGHQRRHRRVTTT